MAKDAINIDDWTVEDVSKWLGTIGLGHKNDLIVQEKVTGSVLVGATAEDLKTMGFSGLQAKKIAKEMEAVKPKTVNTSALQAENTTLRKELDDLKSMVLDLKKRVEMQKMPTTTAAAPETVEVVAFKDPDPVAHKVPVSFCTGAFIEGNQTQFLTVTLSPGDSVRAEPGAMVHMSSWIQMSTKTDGQGLARLLTGQKIFLTEFSYTGPAGTADDIAFTPDFPGQIIPVRLENYGGQVICQKGSLLASANTVEMIVEFTQSLGAGFFGGEGFILQGLYGSGMAFLNARGAIIKKVLTAGQRLTVATGSLVAFQGGVEYRVKTMSGLGNIFFGGEGLFITELVGPGTVWLETHDMSRLWKEMHRND